MLGFDIVSLISLDLFCTESTELFFIKSQLRLSYESCNCCIQEIYYVLEFFILLPCKVRPNATCVFLTYIILDLIAPIEFMVPFKCLIMVSPAS